MTETKHIPAPEGVSTEFREGWEACQAGRNRQTNPYASKRMGATGPARRGQWNAGYDQRDLNGRLSRFEGRTINDQTLAEVAAEIAAWESSR